MTAATTPELSTIGTTVRRLREERGMRLQDLANASDVSRWTLRYIEAGERRANGATYGRIAKGLDVPLDQIIGDAA